MNDTLKYQNVPQDLTDFQGVLTYVVRASDYAAVVKELEDARSYAAEIAMGVCHYPHNEGEPCVRCERDNLIAAQVNDCAEHSREVQLLTNKLEEAKAALRKARTGMIIYGNHSPSCALRHGCFSLDTCDCGFDDAAGMGDK